jgi:hypothetical protein
MYIDILQYILAITPYYVHISPSQGNMCIIQAIFEEIKYMGIYKHVRMLRCYDITIPSACNLQKEIENLTNTNPPFLFALYNALHRSYIWKDDPRPQGVKVGG